jgi:succinate dehydrogenase/fumarate reductase cytochrome b subunit
MWGIGGLSLVGVDMSSMMMVLGNSAIGPVLKFGVAFPLVYHYIAGIRHVVWDKYVMGFNNDAMHQSSLLVGGSSLALSAVAAIL